MSFAFLQSHTQCDRTPRSHILIYCEELEFATALCSKFLFMWPFFIDYQENKISLDDRAHLTGKIKTGWHSLPCIFAKPAPLSLCSSRRGWRQTHRAVKCDLPPSEQVPSTRSRLAVSRLLPSISSSLYVSQMPPTHSPTPTQVKRKTFTPSRRPISQPRVAEPQPKLPSAERKSGENPPVCTLGKALVTSGFQNRVLCFEYPWQKAFYKKTICFSFLQNVIKALANNYKRSFEQLLTFGFFRWNADLINMNNMHSQCQSRLNNKINRWGDWPVFSKNIQFICPRLFWDQSESFCNNWLNVNTKFRCVASE